MDKYGKRRKMKKKPGKENTEPERENLNSSLLANLIGDNVGGVVERRSGVGKRSLCIVDEDASMSEADYNDDEQEKEARRKEEEERQERERQEAARAKPAGIGILANLTQEELDEHYSKCIDLCNKNKVNAKNAFKLQLIDYMKLLISNKSSKSENLTLMSCTLGASAKIYAARVDKVYTDMMKVLSGGGRAAEEDEEEETGKEEGRPEEIPPADVAARRRVASHSSDEEQESSHDKFNYEAKLLTEGQLNKSRKESSTGGADRSVGLIERMTLPRGQELFVESRQLDNGLLALNPPLFPSAASSPPVTPVSLPPDIFQDVALPKAPYSRLDPNEYIVEYRRLRKCFSCDDDSETRSDVGSCAAVAEEVNSSLAFNPHHSNILDSIRLEQDDDGQEEDGGGQYMPDYDDDSEADEMPPLAGSSAASLGQVVSARHKSFSAQSMVSLVSSAPSDYSFFDITRVQFLAGPRHWTIRRAKHGEGEPRGGALAEGGRKRAKKCCDLEFTYDKLQSIRHHYLEASPPSAASETTLSTRTISAWSRSNVRLPKHDRLYTYRHFLSLMKNPNILYPRKDPQTNVFSNFMDFQNEDEGPVLKPEDFGMDACDERDADEDCYEDTATGAGSPGPTDDLPAPPDDLLHLDRPSSSGSHSVSSDPLLDLVPLPQKVNQITLKYARSQKRINIRLLKDTIVETMALDSQKGKEVKFSQVFSEVNGRLPKEESEALSCPIAFMAVLHLANERHLRLVESQDSTDFIITQDP